MLLMNIYNKFYLYGILGNILYDYSDFNEVRFPRTRPFHKFINEPHNNLFFLLLLIKISFLFSLFLYRYHIFQSIIRLYD
jgi:hypothetical protein